jgi:hypothetical protein
MYLYFEYHRVDKLCIQTFPRKHESLFFYVQYENNFERPHTHTKTGVKNVLQRNLSICFGMSRIIFKKYHCWYTKTQIKTL